ncbi:phage major capsid protein [Clostridium paraputrificum]|jgi:HK97 family phage major capsid protein|uniref:phage major capsid protein n=1 Tax=Clostridium paraputrificum TaxID=29363 RepID=UPI00189FDF40|nr:phage major capsid protein [Clostridium paraputrificum]MBS7130533.1 phage major capsid protein [Clostridium sp.]
MKSKEILKLLKAKREEARALAETDMSKAREMLEEIRELEKDLETAQELEEMELRELAAGKPVNPKKPNEEVREVTKEDELRALGKYMTGKALNDEERALVTVSDNGALLPQGYINELMVLRDGFPSLKKYCHVIPVTTKTGRMPIAKLGKSKLSKLSSNQPIGEGAVSTDSVLYDVEDYGSFVPIENSLTDDEVVGLIQNVVIPDFAEGSVSAENGEIMSVVKAKSATIQATSYLDLENAMDSQVPAVKSGLITITNTAGYVHLKNMKDSIGRNLNLITNINGIDYFNSKPIITLSDEDVSPTREGNVIYYIANLREFIKFIDRKTLEIAKSTEFLFNKNQDCLRAIERFDIIEGSARSAKVIEFNPINGGIIAAEVQALKTREFGDSDEKLKELVKENDEK